MTNASPPPKGNRKRSAIVALLLSIFGMGAGYFYLGRPLRALAILIWSIAGVVAAFHGLNGWLATFQGFAAYLALTVGIFLLMVVDTIRIARRSHGFVPRWCNHFVIYALPVFAWFAMSTVKTIPWLDLERAIQPYAIPSTSMTPTLRIGERVIADASAYRNSTPRRGDIAVVTHVSGSEFIKRVVGLPGERIALVDGIVVIDGVASTRRVDAESGKPPGGSVRFSETLPDGIVIAVQQAEGVGTQRTMPEIVIPEGHYFLLGDNRDNSVDSRMSTGQGGLGLVPLARFRARATFVYWSVDTARIGLSLNPG